MRLNPFEFPKGLTLSEHISKLCQVFEGAFPIAPPAPFILDKAIEGIYRAHGWNTNDINTGEKEYPTMSELYDRFQKELSQTTYDSEIQGNIQSVLEMRIGSLLRREMKDIFDVKHSTFSPEEWLKHPVIVELESLGEGPANFVTLLLCTLIRETLKASPRADEEKVVRHIIFIEEAHNLIAPEAQVASGQDSNPKIAATAYIVKMLAEVRALREGIIIADQLPTAMAPEVIKNTNIKLIHRLTSIDDRQLIGSTMSAMESINDSLRDVENKAYDVSKDANQNLQSLEQIRQNVDDEITDSQKAKKKLDQTKKLLDTLGVGKSLEKGVNKLDDHLQEATGLKGEVISAMQDLEKVYRQLDQI